VGPDQQDRGLAQHGGLRPYRPSPPAPGLQHGNQAQKILLPVLKAALWNAEPQESELFALAEPEPEVIPGPTLNRMTKAKKNR
jgi:hypothetical protein